jgi:hypothetical protein
MDDAAKVAIEKAVANNGSNLLKVAETVQVRQ